MDLKKIIFYFFIILFSKDIISYNVPTLSLGSTNFLDGGPIRPFPGLYWLQYFQYYTTDKFLNENGKLLNNVKSPHYNSFRAATEFIYQFDTKTIFNAIPGIDITLPMTFYSKVEKNNLLNLTDSGSGIGDLDVGVYLQWEPLKYKNREIFVHRLLFQGVFPTGKNKQPRRNINPGNDTYYISPYWAATLFITKKFNFSWRLTYLWAAPNRATKIQAGQGFDLNFSAGYQPNENFLFGLNGYYFEQFENNRLCSKEIPNSKERVLGIGPGALYYASTESKHNDGQEAHKELVFFGHLYFETLVKNRTKGIKFVFRFVKHF